jgi:hypothetical protein
MRLVAVVAGILLARFAAHGVEYDTRCERG